MTTKSKPSEEAPVIQKHRRRKRDVLAAVFVWISILCWVCFVAAIVFIDQASPEMQNVFSRFLELELRQEWDKEAVSKALNMMYGVAGLSVLGLILKAMRHRRRADRYPISLIILLLFSILGAVMLQQKL
ncbi:MAG: hypothetical protein HQL72_10605 [Magnetococcales bacterium]|nr:hypothetical protein [Magnetococcales bacterium]